MSDELPIGRRFSHLYLEQGHDLLPDSDRWRHRLAATVISLRVAELSEDFSRELGIAVPWGGQRPDWNKFFAQAEVRDVLDSITIVAMGLRERAREELQRSRAELRTMYVSPSATLYPVWLASCRRIFAEERIGYTVDEHGGVHLAVDAEFQRNRAATVAGLGGSRYANAASQFEAAYSALDEAPPNGKAAVRNVFTSAEGLFRLMFGAGSLAKDEVGRHLPPWVDAAFASDAAARVASHKMVAAFQDWIAACHQYRHEPGTEEPSQPPLGLAILLVSQGASFIRWLVEIDRIRTPSHA